MAKEAPIYDLMLLLSENAEDDQRQKILADVQSAISTAGGSVERDDDWGRRPLAFEIRHQPEAEYHLLQFRAPPTLIDELSHTLRITDGVLRFRVIKVRPGTPPAPSSPPPVVLAASAGHGGSSSTATSPTQAAPPAEAEGPGEGDEAAEPGEGDEAPTPTAADDRATAPGPAAEAGQEAEDAGES